MRIYIIAGENSGDLIAANIIYALRDLNPEISISGVGGILMNKAGVESLFPMSEINKIGFVEILPHIFKLQKLINITVEDILDKSPDLLVTIDAPGFTYRVASKIKSLSNNIKLMHIVAPSVWAYKEGRAQKYANLYDELLTILPFEAPFFEKFGLKTTYIGHPALEQEFCSRSGSLRSEFCSKFGIAKNTKIIAITPGSRVSEIKSHMPIIVESINALSKQLEVMIIFVQPTKDNDLLINTYLDKASFPYLISTDRLKIFAVADVTLAKSGTNILEIAASMSPMIVGYKINYLSYWFIKFLIKIKYVSLVNIIANKEIIPEYIQNNFNCYNITNNLLQLLTNQEISNSQVRESSQILLDLGFRSGDKKPSEKAAMAIMALLSSINSDKCQKNN